MPQSKSVWRIQREVRQIRSMYFGPRACRYRTLGSSLSSKSDSSLLSLLNDKTHKCQSVGSVKSQAKASSAHSLRKSSAFWWLLRVR